MFSQAILPLALLTSLVSAVPSAGAAKLRFEAFTSQGCQGTAAYNKTVTPTGKCIKLPGITSFILLNNPNQQYEPRVYTDTKCKVFEGQPADSSVCNTYPSAGQTIYSYQIVPSGDL